MLIRIKKIKNAFWQGQADIPKGKKFQKVIYWTAATGDNKNDMERVVVETLKKVENARARAPLWAGLGEGGTQ